MAAQAACILCELYGDAHPLHPAAPRHGDKDYARLKERQRFGRERRAAILLTRSTACHRKRRYSQDMARLVAKRMWNPSIQAYRCPCGWWHVGKGEKIGAL